MNSQVCLALNVDDRPLTSQRASNCSPALGPTLLVTGLAPSPHLWLWSLRLQVTSCLWSAVRPGPQDSAPELPSSEEVLLGEGWEVAA